jgi:hypothetical protein
MKNIKGIIERMKHNQDIIDSLMTDKKCRSCIRKIYNIKEV